MNTMTELVCFASIVALTAFLFGIMGCNVGKEQFQNDAVTAGHAEYYLNADYERQWRWRTHCVEEKQ